MLKNKLILFIFLISILGCQKKKFDFNQIDIYTYNLNGDRGFNIEGKPVFEPFYLVSINNFGKCTSLSLKPHWENDSRQTYSSFKVDGKLTNELIFELKKINSDTNFFSYDSTILRSAKNKMNYFKINVFRNNGILTIGFYDDSTTYKSIFKKYLHYLKSESGKPSSNIKNKDFNLLNKLNEYVEKESESFPQNYVKRLIKKSIQIHPPVIKDKSISPYLER